MVMYKYDHGKFGHMTKMAIVNLAMEKMAMYKNGHVQKCQCTKMVLINLAIKNGHGKKPCTNMATVNLAMVVLAKVILAIVNIKTCIIVHGTKISS